MRDSMSGSSLAALFLFFAYFAFTSFGCSSTPIHEHAIVVQDPFEYARDYFGKHGPKEDTSHYKMQSRYLDINWDGKQDVILWYGEWMGQKYGPQLLFIKDISGYRFVGQFDSGYYGIMPLSKDGKWRFALYNSINSEKGGIAIVMEGKSGMDTVETRKVERKDDGTFDEYPDIKWVNE